MPDVKLRPAVRIESGALWALPWSIGIGIGVALGGWLTVAGGSGSPGVTELNLGHDLVAVPLLCAAVAFVVLLAARVLVGFLGERIPAGH